MATVDAYYAIDMTLIDFSEFYNGYAYYGDASSFEIEYYDGSSDILYGSLFYNAYNELVAGTVWAFDSWISPYSLFFSVDGINVSVDAILNAAATFTLVDDYALIANVLRGPDLILGSNYSDVLVGLGGNDRIFGYAGHDDIIGGRGRDVMNGGSGFDSFIFLALADSVKGANRDQIQQFTHADWIDLSLIDAKTNVANNNAFKFIGNQPFHDRAGELRFSGGIVQGDVNGNGVADFEIKITGVAPLVSDFFL